MGQLINEGGIDQACAVLRKPVLVPCGSTERPEAVLHGFARVVGTNPVVVLVELERLLGGGRAGVGVAVAALALSPFNSNATVLSRFSRIRAPRAAPSFSRF